MGNWIQAMRLRTLPLAFASIGMGIFLAMSQGALQSTVAVLCLLTTLSLQILSNLANDYGDSIHGADNDNRKGPKRAVQSGAITKGQMKKAITYAVIISLVLGFLLLFMADLPVRIFWFFLLLGIAAIVAAILYTNGKLPYGYIGLGDISVFLFFGILGVLGTYFLQAQSLTWDKLLPAASCGLLTVGVLNINNIRDIESDTEAGKRSVPVLLGPSKARVYHSILLILAILLSIFYIYINFVGFKHYLFLLTLPLFIKNIYSVNSGNDVESLDPLLKQLALTTLLFVLLFGISINLS